MSTGKKLDTDKVRNALYGQTVGGVTLGRESCPFGNGTQGSVFKFKNMRYGQEGQPEFFAVKVMDFATGKKEGDMIRCAQSRHNPSQHIVTVHGSVENKENDWYALVMEYCPRSLTDFISQHAVENYMRNVQRLFNELCTGLHDIHNRGVIHRDIKAANLLLTSGNDDECHLKISDFGTAKAIENNLTNTIGAGTLAYMAPEVNGGHYTYKIDIWSAGVVLYHMLTGSPILLGGDGNPIVNLGFQRGDLMSGLTVQPLPGIKVSQACLDVLKGFLVCDPNKRIDWDEIICLEWLTEGKEERSLTIDDVDFKYWTKPVLGSGLSCHVYKGVKASTPEEAVAVKVFSRKYVLENSRLFRREIQILEELKTQNHEEFVKYFGHVEGESHYLIYEYCNCTLASQIIGGVSETVAHSYMKQIVAGIKVLHELGYVHRDIKPVNILVKRGSDGSVRLVLSDFGFTTKKDKLDYSGCGTPYFRAPEVKQVGMPLDLIDIWSLGMTLYNILVGSFICVDKEDYSKVLFLTLPHKMRGEVTDACWQFVRRMLTVSPRYRMKYQEMFDDPWLNATEKDLDGAFLADRKACCDCLYTKVPSCSQKCVPRDYLERLLKYDTDTRRAHGFRHLPPPAPGEESKGGKDVKVTSEQISNTFQMFLDAGLVFARKGAACEMLSAKDALSHYHIAVAFLSLIPSSFFGKTESPLTPISARMNKLETDLFKISTGAAHSPSV